MSAAPLNIHSEKEIFMASRKVSIEQYLLDLMLNLMIVLKSKFEQATHLKVGS